MGDPNYLLSGVILQVEPQNEGLAQMIFLLKGVIFRCKRRGVIVLFLTSEMDAVLLFYPIGSMYGIFTYIYHKNQPNGSVNIDHTWILWV